MNDVILDQCTFLARIISTFVSYLDTIVICGTTYVVANDFHICDSITINRRVLTTDVVGIIVAYVTIRRVISKAVGIPRSNYVISVVIFYDTISTLLELNTLIAAPVVDDAVFNSSSTMNTILLDHVASAIFYLKPINGDIVCLNLDNHP